MRWSAIAKLPAGWRLMTEPTLYELKITTRAFKYCLGNFDPLSQLHPRWISGTDSGTKTPVIECPYFWLWEFKFTCMLLKKSVFEASLCTHAPAAASETCLWGPRVGTAPSCHWCKNAARQTRDCPWAGLCPPATLNCNSTYSAVCPNANFSHFVITYLFIRYHSQQKIRKIQCLHPCP